MRHEEAGAFAAGADALLTGELTLCAGSCGPGSLHFINGIFEANRNRAPIVLIASQIERDELEQMTAGTLRIHRRQSDGQFVDETEHSSARVRQLIESLENQIKHLERRQAGR